MSETPSARDLIDRAETARQQGEYAKAVAEATLAIQQTPDDVEALAIRASARLFLGEAELALQDADHALHLDPDQAFVLGTRAEACRVLDQYHDALAAANRVMELSQHWIGYLIRGRIRRSLADFAGAIADLTAAQLGCPDEVSITKELALAQARDASEPFGAEPMYGTDPALLEQPVTKQFLFRSRIRFFLERPVPMENRLVRVTRAALEERHLNDDARAALVGLAPVLEKLIRSLDGEQRSYVAELHSIVNVILKSGAGA